MRPDTICWHCGEPRLIVCARRSLLGRINAAAAMATVHADVRGPVTFRAVTELHACMARTLLPHHLTVEQTWITDGSPLVLMDRLWERFNRALEVAT